MWKASTRKPAGKPVHGDDMGRMKRALPALILPITLLVVSGCNTLQAKKSAPAAAAVTPELQQDYHQALALMAQEQWQEASLRLQAITAQHDQLAGPWLNLGIAYARLGEADKAETALKRASERNPSRAEAFNQLGILYRRAGKFQQAQLAYEQAVHIDPDHADAHWNLGILHDLYLPDTERALHHYQRYQQITGSDDRQLESWISALRERIRSATLTAGVKQP